MLIWVDQIIIGGSVAVTQPVPDAASAIGLTEGPRGALGHWLEIKRGKISRYQIVTPTCWNASPRDSAGVQGPMEQALIGTPVEDTSKPIEVMRVIHSFDPCLACAVHVMRPEEGKKIFTMPHFHGEKEIHCHDHSHDHWFHRHGHSHDHDRRH
jgi:hydrogenase large subunit